MASRGNTLKQRQPTEAMYVGQLGENPYNMNVTRMDSHGSWIASSSDLARFGSHVGGAPGVPSILKPETIAIMTTPAPAYSASSPAKYARGWYVRDNGKGNWWHNGRLPGTTSIMVRRSNGMCRGALTNRRTQPSSTIDTGLDQR